jgi:hypothetical protein
MIIIEVVQKRKYFYVHLFFIYTKKKIGEILGNATESHKSSKTEDLSPKSKPKTPKTETKPSTLLTQWLLYCDKKSIKYAKNNIKYWEEKLEKRLNIEQQEAIYNAIKKGWKDFYLIPIKESKYHKFLGKSLMMEKDCDTLIDIGFKEKRFIYRFKNITISSTEAPLKLFTRHGYVKEEVKTAPMVSQVQDKILGLIRRF